MRIAWPWKRVPAETGEEQLARALASTPPPPVPPGPDADLPAQLDRLRHILELVEHYLYPRSGPLHADVARSVATPDRPLTARRVALLHEADPTHLTDVTGAELAQIASFTLREPERLARDPEATAAAAANLDLTHAVATARRRLGALPRVREEPDLGTWRGWHEYAAAIRREVRRRHRDAPYEDGPRLNWGRREDGPAGPSPRPQPAARAAMLDELVQILPVLWTSHSLRTNEGAPGGPAPPDDEFARWAAGVNETHGFAYHFRGSIGSVHWPIYLTDTELAEVIRRVREARKGRA
ncbi:MAG: hypothetical protein M3R38_18720 [Actinomycetota bacterium]|nr:hypothetical protein [Actinomycetota bacterium]